MKRHTNVVSISLAALLLAGPVFAGGYGASAGGTADQGMMMQKHSSMSMHRGARMTTADGMSLYVFDKDTTGKSNCNGKCAMEWPPMKASAKASPSAHFSVIRRADGTMQWAWKGKPLYMFEGDKVAGQTKGGGYSAEWHVATAM